MNLQYFCTTTFIKYLTKTAESALKTADATFQKRLAETYATTSNSAQESQETPYSASTTAPEGGRRPWMVGSDTNLDMIRPGSVTEDDQVTTSTPIIHM